MGSNPMEGVFEVKNSFFMYNTIFVYILRVPVSMKGSKGHQKSRKQRKQTGFKELAHIWGLCSASRASRGRASRGGRSGNCTHEGHTKPGMGSDWRHCAGLDLRYFEADGDGWFMPRMVFQLFNRQESLKDGIGLPKQKPSGILRVMAFDEVCPE